MSNPMISIDEFAARHNVATRTVRRWLDDDRVPGAVKLAGKWSLPADAAVQDRAAGAIVTAGHVNDVAMSAGQSRQQPTVPAILAQLPVFLTLDVASRVLGVSEYALRQNADYFELQRLGAHGAYVMPKARVRELEG